MEMGGLGVGCLDSSNLALLTKYWRHLKNDRDSFWFYCIKEIHNPSFIDGKLMAKKSIKGVWLDISHISIDLNLYDISLGSLFKRIVGKGDYTFYWKDSWCGDGVLKDVFPNLYAVENNKNCLVMDKIKTEAHMNVQYCWDWKRNLKKGS
ncbi:hypothetical protein Lser_V15G20393 [Lactuca serriola]